MYDNPGIGACGGFPKAGDWGVIQAPMLPTRQKMVTTSKPLGLILMHRVTLGGSLGKSWIGERSSSLHIERLTVTEVDENS